MRSKFLIILLAMLLAFSALFVGCQDDGGKDPVIDEPNKPVIADRQDILFGWDVNGDEEVYDINEVGDALSVDYNKMSPDFAWAYMKYNMAVFELEQLEDMQTLVFTVDYTMETGSARTFINFEYPDNSNSQIKFDLVEGKHTYEYDLSGIDFINVVRIILFADGGGTTGTGNMTFSEFYITKDAVNAENEIKLIVPPESSTVPVNEYTDGDTFIANAGWYDGGDGVYTVTEEDEGYVATYDKASYTYASLMAYVSGDLSKMNKVTFTVTGGEYGNKLLIKLFDSIEKRIFLTGEEQTVEISLVNPLMKNVDWTIVNRILLFSDENVTDVTGTLTIHNVEFSTDYVEGQEPAPVAKEPTKADITASNWTGDITTADSDSTYKLTDSDNGLIVDYTKTAGNALHRLTVAPSDMATYKYVVFTVTGTEGKTALFSVDNKQVGKQEITFTGDKQTVRLTVNGNDDVTVVLDSTLDNGSGTMTIHYMFMQDTEAGYIVTVERTGWTASVADVYSHVLVNGELKINYSKKNNPYATFNRVDAFMTSYNQVIINVTIPDGVDVMFKLVGGTEEAIVVTGNGAQQTVVLSNYGCNNKLSINVGNDSTGTFSGFITISSIAYATEGEDLPAIPGESVDHAFDSSKWLNASKTYVLTDKDGVLEVVCTKTEQYPEGFIAMQNDDLKGCDYIVLEFTGEKGVEYTFRVTSGGTMKDVKIVATGEKQIIELANDGNARLHIYALKDLTEGTTTFIIHSLKLKTVA